MSGLGLSSPRSLDPLPTASGAAQAETTAALHKGANWLFLIGGLSMVNTVSLISGSQWLFLGGLGITEFAAAIAMQFGTKGQLIGLFVNLWATAFLCVWDFLPAKDRNGLSSPAWRSMRLTPWSFYFFSSGSCSFSMASSSSVFTRGSRAAAPLHAFDKRSPATGMPIGS